MRSLPRSPSRFPAPPGHRLTARPATHLAARLATRCIALLGLLLATALGSAPFAAAQEDAGGADAWDVTAPRGETRDIDFTTDEGTWMSIDLEPGGEWLVFDLLGHIYRLPTAGGEAEVLTRNSGVAVNYHPRISPDGSTIAFISDRGGQSNLWLMDADGSNPRPVFDDQGLRAWEPAWSPDGRFIAVRRASTRRGGGGPPTGLWMYAREGGEGVRLVGSDHSDAQWPSFSADGASLYFHFRAAPPGLGSGRLDVTQGHKQIRRLDLETGRVDEITSGLTLQQGQTSSGGALAPEPSPGRTLARLRAPRIPDGTISYKGLRFGPRTALWLRDLDTGGGARAHGPDRGGHGRGNEGVPRPAGVRLGL